MLNIDLVRQINVSLLKERKIVTTTAALHSHIPVWLFFLFYFMEAEADLFKVRCGTKCDSFWNHYHDG